MGRPRAFVYKNIGLYDKLHTTKVKMMSGVYITALYLMKETTLFFVSTEVWAYCASKIKLKKPATLSVNIPVITDEKTVAFLEKRCWKDYVDKAIAENRSDTLEAISFLKRIFPDKKPKFFYEIDSLINLYIQGNIVGYDRDGKEEVISEHDIESQKYYNHKYSKFQYLKDVPEIKEAFDKYSNEKDKTLKDKFFDVYYNLEQEYAFKNNNLIDVFKEIGEKAVCFPVGFSKSTADWHIEKYGKVCGYAHVGEIFFVATEDSVFFEVKRHY